jgi:NNP family nitrate/nitrite transporter-like MFS transporter
VVGLAGGLGGFILPILFGALAGPDRHPHQRLHADVRRGLRELVWMHYSQRAANARPTPETLQAA